MFKPKGMTEQSTLFYIFVWRLVRLIFRVVFRLRITGSENIPESGGLILASNHASLFDPPLVGSSTTRVTFSFAKKELFRYPLFGRIISSLNAIPVDRYGLSAQALKTFINLLREGYAVIVYIEGTRTKTGELGNARPGVGLMAITARVPVVPVYVRGTYHAFRRFRMSVHFGKPVYPDEQMLELRKTKRRREVYQQFSEEVMKEIRRLEEETNN